MIIWERSEWILWENQLRKQLLQLLTSWAHIHFKWFIRRCCVEMQRLIKSKKTNKGVRGSVFRRNQLLNYFTYLLKQISSHDLEKILTAAIPADANPVSKLVALTSIANMCTWRWSRLPWLYSWLTTKSTAPLFSSGRCNRSLRNPAPSNEQ